MGKHKSGIPSTLRLEEKDLNNEHRADSMAPSSKSRSRRKPATGARGYGNSRLNDAAINNQKRKRPNAQKHGFFSSCPTIPGENPREFIGLYSAMLDEWQPSGPTEVDAVYNLADLMWRNRRAQKMLRAKLITETCHPGSPTFDARRGFDLFIYCMRTEPETAFERHASKLLTTDNISHLARKFPRSNYQSTSEWAEAVIAEIKSVLLPAALPSLESTEPEEGDLPEPFRKLVVETLVAASIHLEKEFFEDELNLCERLEVRIHRQVKHLIQLKAMKQMLRQSSVLREDEQPKRITARSVLQ
jgi:hypothetical protein